MFLIWLKLASQLNFFQHHNHDLLTVSTKYGTISKTIIRSHLNNFVNALCVILLTTIDPANILVVAKATTATCCENKSKTCAESAIRTGFVPATFRKLTIQSILLQFNQLAPRNHCAKPLTIDALSNRRIPTQHPCFQIILPTCRQCPGAE